MIRICFVLAFLCLSVFSLAQRKGTARLYGFQQNVLPGSPKGGIDVNGNDMPGPGGGQNYLIYINSSTTIYPAEIWINGEPYAASYQRKRGAVKQPGTTDSLTLVPAGGTTWELSAKPITPGKEHKSMKAIAAKHALVVVYKKSGRFYYSSLKEWKKLPDAAAM